MIAVGATSAGSREDSCRDADTVLEYFCNGAQAENNPRAIACGPQGCEDGRCLGPTEKKRTTSPCSSPSQCQGGICTGGICRQLIDQCTKAGGRDYLVKGHVDAMSGGEPAGADDQCVDNFSVKEFYCDGPARKEEKVWCHCTNGACTDFVDATAIVPHPPLSGSMTLAATDHSSAPHPVGCYADLPNGPVRYELPIWNGAVNKIAGDRIRITIDFTGIATPQHPEYPGNRTDLVKLWITRAGNAPSTELGLGYLNTHATQLSNPADPTTGNGSAVFEIAKRQFSEATTLYSLVFTAGRAARQYNGPNASICNYDSYTVTKVKVEGLSP